MAFKLRQLIKAGVKAVFKFQEAALKRQQRIKENPVAEYVKLVESMHNYMPAALKEMKKMKAQKVNNTPAYTCALLAELEINKLLKIINGVME